MTARPGGTVAFLVATIEASTRLWEQRSQALARHDASHPARRCAATAR